MSWMYRLFRRNNEETSVTLDPSVTSLKYGPTSSQMINTSAANSGGIEQSFQRTFTQGELVAGVANFVPGVTGYKITVLHYRIMCTGTNTGTGNFIIQDTTASPILVVTATVAALATGTAPAFISSEIVTTSGVTVGAGLAAPLGSGKGLSIPAMASLTGTATTTVTLDYIMTVG